ncbi:glycosyltransferase, partial [bacterium]|nr:glycosyltransferase [candidate division CSSED10-310 bacterium]
RAIPRRSGLARRCMSSWDAWRIARSIDADVFHFHDPDLLPWMVLLKIMGRSVVYDSHENFIVRFYQWSLPGWLRSPLARIFRSCERWSVRRFDGFIAPDHHIYSLFEADCRDGAVIRNTHDLDRLDAEVVRQPRDPFPVLYTSGSNLPDRHCEEMIRAMPIILNELPNCRLRFAGYYDRDYKDYLKRLARELNVSEQLDLWDAEPYFTHFGRSFRATVGCIFLQNNPKNRNANSNRLFEYMYCGLPVLAENLPGPRSVVESEQCGLIIDSSHPEAIAEAFVYLVKHPEVAQEMGARGERAVRARYHYGVDLKELTALYSRIISTHQAGNA